MERAVLDDSCVWVILIKRKSRHDAFRRLVMESHDHAFIVRGCFTGSEDGVFCRPLRGREGWMCRAGPFERQPQRASQAPWRFPARKLSRPKFSGNVHQSRFLKRKVVMMPQNFEACDFCLRYEYFFHRHRRIFVLDMKILSQDNSRSFEIGL